ncbi:MAG: hypothetical protein VX777_00405 [Chlamydiota bacterium]|nr:hypothetical protein [Chlamydiota bacterium]
MLLRRKKSSVLTVVVQLVISTTVLLLLIKQFIEHQNLITEVSREIPKIEKSLRNITEQNTSLLYEIERFENPLHLMELSKQPEFSHLRFPTYEEVLIIKDNARRDLEQ